VSALEVGLRNLGAWSVQAAVIGLCAAALSRLLPIERPRPRLAFYQLLLVLLLGLPLVQPWHRVSGSRADGGAAVSSSTSEGGVGVGAWTPWVSGWPLPVASVVVAGVAFRLFRSASGLARLRVLRRSGEPLDEAPWLAALRLAVAPRTRLVLSPHVKTPAAFGLLQPTVVLPTAFTSMGRGRQEAVVLHELLHVRRRDWLPLLAEELLLAVFFFHPAVHWLVGRIRLAREQVVDETAVGRLGGPEPYLQSLLEMAQHAVEARAVPAAPFLRESHLRERVDLLLKEVVMSKVRTLAHASLTAAALVLTAGLAFSAAPLRTPAGTDAAEPIRAEAKLIHKVNPVYPEDAKAAKAEGVIRIGVLVGKDGAIRDATVVASAPSLERMKQLDAAGGGSTAALEADPRLASAALDAARQWRYEPYQKDSRPVEVRMTLTIRFRLD
jgi:D-alanyl-D-alanine endopeptidase (penicillin-binding protein 7)